MRRYLSFPAIVLIAIVVHVDWHFGGGGHHHMSLNSPYHWITGLVAFFLLALFCARKWPENTIGALLLNGVLGLFVGQIVEPLGEWALNGFSTPGVFTGGRWRIFAQFVVAAAIGLVLGVGAAWVLLRGRRVNSQPV